MSSASSCNGPSSAILEYNTLSWASETAINCALQITVGAIAGAALSCPVAGAACAGGYSLLKSSFSGLSEAVHFIGLEQAKKEEDCFLNDTANKIGSFILSCLYLPFIPLLLCIQISLAVSCTVFRLIQNYTAASLLMGAVYIGAASSIGAPTAAMLAAAACLTDFFQGTIIGKHENDRIFAQSFNIVAQIMYPYPLNRILTL